MKDWPAIQKRYLRDAMPVRLGGLAANLRRIKSFVANEAGQDAVASLIEESKLLIEWIAAEAPVDTAAQLIELQVQLARWQLKWPTIWPDEGYRMKIGEDSLIWSNRILGLSGLLKK